MSRSAALRPLLASAVLFASVSCPSALRADSILFGEVLEADRPGVVQGTRVRLESKETRGFFSRRTWCRLVLEAPDSEEARLRSQGFQPLQAMKLVVTWSRIGNINGWGTDVNGEVTRRAGIRPAYTGDQIPAGLDLASELLVDWRAASERIEPEAMAQIFANRPANSMERSFKVRIRVTATAIDPTSGNTVTLLDWGKSSPEYGF